MSDSKTLSKTQEANQKNILKENPNAKNGENELKRGVNNCLKKLKEYFDSTHIQFLYSSKCDQKSIIEQTIKYFGKNHNFCENNDSFFKPDGGIIYYELQTQKYMTLNIAPLFCAEYKKQGDGKDQASGNAIERCFKNVKEYELYTINSPSFLYFLFCSGRDFKKGSTIKDRLTALTLKRPFNTTYFEKERGYPSCSVYLKDEGYWDAEAMGQIMFEGSKKVIETFILTGNNHIRFENLPNV